MANKKTTQANTNTNAEVVMTTAQILDVLKSKVEEARASLQASADKCNEHRSNEDFRAIEVEKANRRELEKVCAKACKDAAFYELAYCSEDAIKAAISAKSFMTYVCRDIKDSETASISTEVESKEVFISLKEMDTYCTTHGIGGSVDKAWSGEFMALAGAIIAQTVLGFTDEARREEVIKSLKDDYYFSKALVKHQAALENADLADPTSRTQIKKLGQSMVEHLVGQGFVFKDDDYNFLTTSALFYDKKTQKVDVLKSRDLYNLNNKVFQHIVYGIPYEIKVGKKK